MDRRQIKFIISNIIPFNKVGERHIDRLLSLGGIREYKGGEVVYHEGDAPDYFYLLLTGRLIAVTEQEEGEKTLELLKRGTSFGIISLFTDESHSVTVKAIETSYVLIIEKEVFKRFLHKHPLLFLDFSRLLSQRVKRRAQPKTIFQSRHLAITGPSLSGKTTYLYHLGKALRIQTRKKVICIEIAREKSFQLPFLSKIDQHRVLELEEFREQDISSSIMRDDIDMLLIKSKELKRFDALLNFLSESYHFILYEIPSWRQEGTFALLKNAHYIHLLTAPQTEQLLETKSLIASLERRETNCRQKLNLIVNELAFKNFSQPRIKSILKYPVYATVPSLEEAQYQKTMRRIARHLGEVVLGLALGSGAAYGFSHIGVLKVLREYNIEIDMICGTSMGALIAALWAAGFSITRIEEITLQLVKKINFWRFARFSFPMKGILGARRLQAFLRSVFGNRTFDDLEHPLKIVAFDFLKREAKVLEKGLLAHAVAASCAMPGIFEPVKLKKEVLLDGGILNPLPTKILLRYGVDRIIAVNITPSKEAMFKEYQRRHKLHIFDFIFGSIETMQQEFIVTALKLADVVVHPNMEGLGWMEFEQVKEFIRRGESATRSKIKEIQQLIKA